MERKHGARSRKLHTIFGLKTILVVKLLEHNSGWFDPSKSKHSRKISYKEKRRTRFVVEKKVKEATTQQKGIK